MPPGSGSPRRKPRENQYLFDLGVRGRKTGLTVPDSGIRDEHGLEPLDNLFSSPEKAPNQRNSRTNGSRRNANITLSSEEDMDVGESTIPEPAAVLTERKRSSMRMPPPRAKSPIKTFLQSPARRHPSLGPVSSPARGSIVSPLRATQLPSVIRNLDFSADDLGRNHERTPIRSSPQKRQAQPRSGTQPLASDLSNGRKIKLPSVDLDYEAQEDENSFENGDSYQVQQEEDYNANEDFQVGRYTENAAQERSSDAEQYAAPISSKKRGRPPMAKTTAVKRGKGQPPRSSMDGPTEYVYDDDEPELMEEEPEERPAKKRVGRPKKSETSKVQKPEKVASGQIAKPGRKRNSSLSKISSPPEIQRGPPRPNQNRGLYSIRRETPDLGGFSHTRSGRHVFKPVAYWKNESAIYEDDGDGEASFLLPTIKEVIRKEEIEEQKSTRGRRKGVRTKKRRAPSESEEEEDNLAEPWESEPGRIFGDIRAWNPDDLVGAESAEREEEIALSNAAIITREIPGSSFKFAKTLTHPFFGSGMVDLPPGAVKKPKNSRKMQMVFFVHYGRVCVTVNDNTFRIGKGGMWQVPRGNFYSIENDYEAPARIFFSQGCEVLEEGLG